MSNATHGWKDGDRAMVILEDVTIGGAHAKGQRKDMDAWLPFACFHPLPIDPHAALKDAVVEAAVAWRDAQEPKMSRAEFLNAGDRLFGAVLALNAARTPPDPWADLLKAARQASIQLDGQECHTGASFLREAIAAVEAMRRGA